MSLTVAPLGPGDEAGARAVVALWAACGLTRPWNDANADLEFALASESAAVLVGRAAGVIVATAMTGHDGHRGAVYYLAVSPEHQRKRYGATMMAAVEAWLKARGVPKLNLMVRAENRAVAAFYAALGYAVEDRINLAKRL
ncbi:MAG: GNAT family acetyltransferase [Pseudomonadota bacterium]